MYKLVFFTHDESGYADSTYDYVEFEVEESNSVQNSTVTTYRFFPNPVKDLMHVEFDSSINSKNVTILSLDGKTVYLNKETTKLNEILNLENINPGAYLLKIQDGNSTQIEKFVKR
jgi:hypothetical protein